MEGCKHLSGLGSPGEKHNVNRAGRGMRFPMLEVNELQYGNGTIQSLWSGLEPTRAEEAGVGWEKHRSFSLYSHPTDGQRDQ